METAQQRPRLPWVTVDGHSKVLTEPGLAECLKALQAERRLLKEQKKGAELIIKTKPEVKALLETSEAFLENQIKQVRSGHT